MGISLFTTMAVAMFLREEMQKLTAGAVYRQNHPASTFWRRNKWRLGFIFVAFAVVDTIQSLLRRRLWRLHILFNFFAVSGA